MAWVQVIPEDAAEGELKEAYARVRQSRGRVANVIAISGLLPQVMLRGIDFYMALMYGAHRLPRPQREMVAVEVSRANGCEYCVRHHAAALARVATPELAQRIADGQHAGLPPRDLAMLGYARKLTLTPRLVGPGDVGALRSAGLGEQEIVAVNHIVAYFNMMNRVVQGLGVELEPDQGAAAEYRY